MRGAVWEPLGGSLAGWLEVPLETSVDGHLVWLVFIDSASGHLPAWWVSIPDAALRKVSPSHVCPVL